MCKTCGCSDGADVRVEGEHTHVLADGTAVRHTHGHSHDHSHLHDHSHSHSEDHSRPHGNGGNGHGATRTEELEVRVLEKNERLASRNRRWLRERGVVALNLMSSPGSGKTTLLEQTLRRVPGKVAVLEGDQETSRDADRIRATGAAAIQINTGEGCHLDADMVWRGVEALPLDRGATLFIENVGNLVCPALFDLGEDARVVLFSVTEGEDKPLKYPHMFRTADLVLLTKSDLLPHLDFDVERARSAIAEVTRRDVPILEVSAKSGAGMQGWLDWLAARRKE